MPTQKKTYRSCLSNADYPSGPFPAESELNFSLIMMMMMLVMIMLKRQWRSNMARHHNGHRTMFAAHTLRNG